MTEESDLHPAQSPAAQLTVRPASVNDLDAFLELARLCMAERARPFSEDEARWVFAGLPRADPAIHMLLCDLEVVGFVIVRQSNAPLTRVPCMHQEVLFVRADKRSKAAEMLLHRMTLEVFKALPVDSEISLLVDPSPHAFEVIDELRRIGPQDAQVRMKAVRVQAEPPASSEKTSEASPPTLH